jgi:hypothetical protein
MLGHSVGYGVNLLAIPGGIELIQWFHRYAVVAPSTNPKVGDAPYRWIDEASDETLDGPPDVADLPDLPWAWIGGLANHGNGKNADRLATDAEVRGFFDNNNSNSDPQHCEASKPNSIPPETPRAGATTPQSKSPVGL